jgi:hypothetical protein
LLCEMNRWYKMLLACQIGCSLLLTNMYLLTFEACRVAVFHSLLLPVIIHRS